MISVNHYTKQLYTFNKREETDDRVQSDLEQKWNDDPNLSEEDREYYKKQLKDFKKFREYHDTYIVGQDEKGTRKIVSVSNKKSSKEKQFKNNTKAADTSYERQTIFGDMKRLVKS